MTTSFPAIPPRPLALIRTLKADVRQRLRGDMKLERTFVSGHIQHSYDLAYSALTRTQRTALDAFFVTCLGRKTSDITFPDPWETGFYDGFNRANTSDGQLGTAPGGGVWDLRGSYVASYPLPAATKGKIVSGQFVTTDGVTVYASQTLSETPDKIGAKVNWTAGNGGAQHGTVTLIISSDANLINDMLHFYANPTYWALQIRIAGGAFETLAEGNFSPSLAIDGTSYTFEVSVSGNDATVVHPQGTETATDARIPARLGPWVVWEHSYNGAATYQNYLHIETVWCGVRPVTCRLDLDSIEMIEITPLLQWTGSLKLIEVADWQTLKAAVATFPATVPFQKLELGLQYKTIIESTDDNAELSYQEYTSSIRRWRVGGDALTDAQATALLGCYEGNCGPWRAFSFTDPETTTVYSNCHFVETELAHVMVQPGVNSCHATIEQVYV